MSETVPRLDWEKIKWSRWPVDGRLAKTTMNYSKWSENLEPISSIPPSADEFTPPFFSVQDSVLQSSGNNYQTAVQNYDEPSNYRYYDKASSPNTYSRNDNLISSSSPNAKRLESRAYQTPINNQSQAQLASEKRPLSNRKGGGGKCCCCRSVPLWALFLLAFIMTLILIGVILGLVFGLRNSNNNNSQITDTTNSATTATGTGATSASEGTSNAQTGSGSQPVTTGLSSEPQTQTTGAGTASSTLASLSSASSSAIVSPVSTTGSVGPTLTSASASTNPSSTATTGAPTSSNAASSTASSASTSSQITTTILSTITASTTTTIPTSISSIITSQATSTPSVTTTITPTSTTPVSSSTTISIDPNLLCDNNGSPNGAGGCSCQNGFSGAKCEILPDCATLADDPVECDVLIPITDPKDYKSIQGYCPKRLICNLTTATP